MNDARTNERTNGDVQAIAQVPHQCSETRSINACRRCGVNGGSCGKIDRLLRGKLAEKMNFYLFLSISRMFFFFN